MAFAVLILMGQAGYYKHHGLTDVHLHSADGESHVFKQREATLKDLWPCRMGILRRTVLFVLAPCAVPFGLRRSCNLRPDVACQIAPAHLPHGRVPGQDACGHNVPRAADREPETQVAASTIAHGNPARTASL